MQRNYQLMIRWLSAFIHQRILVANAWCASDRGPSTTRRESMKHILIAAAFLTSNLAFAHGTLPEQAASAIHVAAEMMEHSQPKEVLKEMLSVTATKKGHEQFDVVFTLNDGTTFNYACEENESVNPVVWECAAL